MSPMLSPSVTTASKSSLYPFDDRTLPLKVLLVVPYRVPMWVNAFIALASGSRHVQLDALLVEDMPVAAPAAIPLDLHICLWLERFRRRHIKSQVSPQEIDRARLQLISEVPGKTCNPEQLRSAIAESRPDIVLSMAPSAWAQAWSDCTKLGSWALGSDLSDPHSAGLALLAPILSHSDTTQAGLELRGEDGKVLQAESGWAATSPISFDLHRDQMFRKLPALLMRLLRKIAAGERTPAGDQFALLCLVGRSPAVTFGSGIKALQIAFSRTFRVRLRRRHREPPWFLLVREVEDFLDPGQAVFNGAAAIVAPRDDYWADPCLVTREGQRFIFVEEFATSRNIGLIACLELLPSGEVARLGIVLDEAHHLSYPSIFEWKEEIFMTVESGNAGRVSLYKALNFPLEWCRVADLLEGRRCVDPTLHFHEGHWYLFANVSESGGGTSDELFLFVSEALEGPYLPHPSNPIVTDVRRARPAGHLFTHAGRLIRPAQSCAPTYGAAIVFHEVTQLTPTAFHERALSRLDPECGAAFDGCHTYSRSGQVEVIDVHGLPPPARERKVIIDIPPANIERSTDNPLVSAIVPAYNAERFLALAIESALAQTLASVEVVIVNDGSKDSTGQIADHYAAMHPDRVRVVHQQNQGLPFARNAAIEVARGRYLALLDADDVWLPGHIESCVALLESDPGIGLVHANDEVIDVDGNPHGSQSARWKESRDDPYTAILLRKQHVNCPTAVFRKSIVEAIGPFDGLFNRLGCEDRDMWLRLAEVSKLAYIDQIQAQYRVHGSNMSSNHAVMLKARHVLVNKHAARSKGRHLRRRAIAAIYADEGHELARHAPVMPALKAFVKAIAHDPGRLDAWKGFVRRILVGRRS